MPSVSCPIYLYYSQPMISHWVNLECYCTLGRTNRYQITFAPSKDSDLLVHPRSLIKDFTGRSLGSKRPKLPHAVRICGCTAWSEFLLGDLFRCWSHITFVFFLYSGNYAPIWRVGPRNPSLQNIFTDTANYWNPLQSLKRFQLIRAYEQRLLTACCVYILRLPALFFFAASIGAEEELRLLIVSPPGDIFIGF